MSLSALMGALLEYVGDVIVNDCGRPVPDRVLRYHGALPDDCCTENGVLAASWTDGRASTDFPASAAQNRNDPCAAKPLYTITVRYKVCWPVPEADESGVQLIDPAWDDAAATLADTADCVHRALLALTCVQPGPVDPYAAAVWAQVAGRWLRLLDVAPSVAFGSCAGVLWRVNAAPTPGPVS